MKGKIPSRKPGRAGGFNDRCAVARYIGPKTPKHGRVLDRRLILSERSGFGIMRF
ncbi:hypothetical protein MES5069_70335 [Mesorhizobium escarrei]|uniref:Uncharacterized protein n=1 Tax=Mesorhizobium escarrei TaxID=666018 RepID=A0ABN8KEQ7_9HYPH|nr:hypothetical protein MES5069_70335 [Mesorhizobium escarrei]